MGNKTRKREATEGDVLNRWLQGVRAKALTPFFFEHKLVSNQFMFRREAPSGSYYPIADKSNNIKPCQNHQVTHFMNGIYPFYIKPFIPGGTIFE